MIPAAHGLGRPEFPTGMLKGLADFGFNAGDLQAIDRDNAARLLPRAGRSA
jgi:hypothetical protein